MCNKFYIFLALLFFIGFSQSISAQIRVGVKAGGNLYDNYQIGKKYFVSSPNVGFHVGAYGDYTINEKLYSRVEVLFSTRGMYLSEYPDGSRVDYKRQSSYVDFPISGYYNVWKELNVHVGVVPSLFIKEFRSSTKDAEGFKVDGGDQFKSYERWQFGAFAGASYNFTLFSQNFEGGVRYSMAFTKTNELISGVPASRDLKYMMLQTYIAYKIFEF